VVLWNPALIKSLGTARDSGSISSNNRNLLRRIDFLASLGRTLSTFPSLSATSLLWEKSRDPSAVDKVAGTGEESCEEEVKE
jgi:hypothetical protein